MKKNMEIYQNNWGFEQIYNFRTLIYHEKLWYFSKNNGTMGKKYGTLPRNMDLWLTKEKLCYLSKLVWTIVNYSKL